MAELSQQKREEIINFVINKLDELSTKDIHHMFNVTENHLTNASFNELFTIEFDKSGFTVEKLAEHVGVSKYTVNRCKKHSTKVSKERITRLCIGMGTDVNTCSDLLKLRGYCFTDSFIDRICIALLYTREKLSMIDCNIIISTIMQHNKNISHEDFKEFRDLMR